MNGSKRFEYSIISVFVRRYDRQKRQYRHSFPRFSSRKVRFCTVFLIARGTMLVEGRLLQRARVLKYGTPRVKGRDMEKWMCYGALGVAGLMGLLFLLDLAIGKPFGGGPFSSVDIVGLLAAIAIAYLGYSSMKDLR